MIINELKLNLLKEKSASDYNILKNRALRYLSTTLQRFIIESLSEKLNGLSKADFITWSIIDLIKNIISSKLEKERAESLLKRIVLDLHNSGSISNDCFLFNEKVLLLAHSREDGTIDDCEGGRSKPEELVIIRGRIYRKDSKSIVKDYFDENKYVVKKDCIGFNQISRNGLVGIVFDKKHTSGANSDRLVQVYSSKHNISGYCLYDDFLINCDEFKEDFKQGFIIDKTDRLSDKYNPDYSVFKNITKKYNLDLKNSINFGIKSPTNSITEGLPYSFGVELEVNNGSIPPYAAHKYMLNISSMRDGSINNGNGGAEIVTGVLYGDSGFMNLQKICNQLSLRSTVDKTCGMHVHVGNIDFTDQFIVNSYILFKLLEDEIFSLLPRSRRENRYCRRLKDIKGLKIAKDNNKDNIDLINSYNKIFEYVSHTSDASHPNSKFNKNTQHPLGPKCSYSRDTQRYCWINYVPAVYNTRGDIKSKTIEIRNHQGTTSFVKTKNWTLLFMAICAFAERHFDMINDKLTINDILIKIYPKNHKKLIEFFQKRKDLFKDIDSEEKEYLNSEEKFKNLKEVIYT